MREAERHRCGLAATADRGRPGCDPNSPVPSHPRSVTLPYSEVHVIDRPSGLHDILHAPGALAGFSWSHPRVGHVVPSIVSDWCVPGEFALNLVGDADPLEEFLTGSVDVLDRCDDGTDIVARVGRLAGREKGIYEVEIARQRRVVHRGAGG